MLARSKEAEIGFEMVKEKQRVMWGAGPFDSTAGIVFAPRRAAAASELDAFVAFFDEYRSEDGIRQPRPYLIAHGKRR
jgi:hypothetical protein